MPTHGRWCPVRRPGENQYRNGVALFTGNGRAAREFSARVHVGRVGIIEATPVPVAYHSFGGWKRPAFGDTYKHCMQGVRCRTEVKTVTRRWPGVWVGDATNAFVIPTGG